MVRASADQRVETDRADLSATLAGAGVTVLTGDAWLTSAHTVASHRPTARSR
jgi:hypothetical protein